MDIYCTNTDSGFVRYSGKKNSSPERIAKVGKILHSIINEETLLPLNISF